MAQRLKQIIVHEQTFIAGFAGHSWWIFEHHGIWCKPENALEADLKWLLRRLVADWSGQFALCLFWVSVPFWDLRGDTLICDFDTCAYNCEGQSNWRAPDSQVRSDMQQLRRKVAHIHICICINMYTYQFFDMSFLHYQLHNALKHTRAYLVERIHAEKIVRMHMHIYIHIHTLKNTYIYRCVMWELIDCPHFRDKCIDVKATWELIDCPCAFSSDWCFREFCVMSGQAWAQSELVCFGCDKKWRKKAKCLDFRFSDLSIVTSWASMFV